MGTRCRARNTTSTTTGARSALRGTGSNTLVVDNAFIPDHRCINPWEVSAGTAPGTRINPSPLFRLPFGPALAYYLSAPALGAAERTLADWLHYIAGKRQAFTGAEVGKQAPTLIRAGDMSAQLEAARLLMTTTPRAIDEAILARSARPGAAGPLRTERDLRSAAVRRGRGDLHAVQRGDRVCSRHHPVQQGWRDVHGVAAHVGFGSTTRTAPTATCSWVSPSHRHRCSDPAGSECTPSPSRFVALHHTSRTLRKG